MGQVALDQQSLIPPLFSDHSNYIDYCLELAASKVIGFDSIFDFEKQTDSINAYMNLNTLKRPKNLVFLDDKTLKHGDYLKALKLIIDGKLFTEHFAAGEATRLNLGTKYLINLSKDLTFGKMMEMINQEKGTRISEDFIRNQILCSPSDLLPLSLGVRHMLQYAYDICLLSKSLGYDPKQVLLKQRMLIVLNEATADIIIDEFINHRFYGFKQQNIFFMIQKAYHGITLKNKAVYYDLLAPKRLHNHGHIAIQQTMPNAIFNIKKKNSLNYLSSDEFYSLLKDMDMKISYNIEDLSYLMGSIDQEGLALALKKNKEGYHMLMEVLPNNSEAPQKGGMAAFDPILNQDIMIESFQLNGIENHQIEFLNKNINYYPEPHVAWEQVEKYGLEMHITVKDGFLYFQPIIGDINFLVKTLIFTRKKACSIKAWKSATTTPLAFNSMYVQDQQKGFYDYAKDYCDL